MRYLISFLPLFLLLAACGGSGDSASDSRQPVYDTYLEVSRAVVLDIPDAACNPDFWPVAVEGAREDGRPLPELYETAFIDACKEAGHLGDLAQFSAYYPD